MQNGQNWTLKKSLKYAAEKKAAQNTLDDLTSVEAPFMKFGVERTGHGHSSSLQPSAGVPAISR
jgi:hypothetical protein